MSVEELLQHVPPIARYQREPLEDRKNALLYWDEAAAGMVRLDEALHNELARENPDACAASLCVTQANVGCFRQFLENNRGTFELLHAGVRCGQIQFPELEEEGGSFSEHAESMNPLAELAQAWSILAQSQMTDGNLPDATSEFIALGHMGHIVCCGEGLVMHYLSGCAIMGMSLDAIQGLVAETKVPSTVLNGLSEAIDHWIAGDVTQCRRVELCTYSLNEINRLAKCGSLEARVEELLDRHYTNEATLDPQGREAGAVDDDRLAWRQECILRLLEKHPASFDEIATVRLLGELVADRILDLAPRPSSTLLGGWSRLRRAYRRSRFRSRSRLWPSQFTASWPYECLGPSEDAQRHLAELREYFSKEEWNQVQPPTDEQLDAARRRIHLSPNAFGTLVVDALLAADISTSEQLRRHRLLVVKALISEASATSSA